MISTRISGPGVEEYAMQLDPAIHLPMDTPKAKSRNARINSTHTSSE